MNYIKISLRAIIGILSIFAALQATAQCGHTFHKDDYSTFDFEYRIISPNGELVYEQESFNEDYVLFQTCDDDIHHIWFYVDGILEDHYVIQRVETDYAITHEGNSVVKSLDFLAY